jgi:hypothetical protein
MAKGRLQFRRALFPQTLLRFELLSVFSRGLGGRKLGGIILIMIIIIIKLSLSHLEKAALGQTAPWC